MGVITESLVTLDVDVLQAVSNEPTNKTTCINLMHLIVQPNFGLVLEPSCMFRLKGMIGIFIEAPLDDAKMNGNGNNF